MKGIHKITCLPVAGIQNPYQYLMIEGLNKSNRLKAFNGVDDRFFGIYKTVKKFKPDYLHFDWIQSYYIRRTFWMTLLLLPLFIAQIYYIRWFSTTKIVWTLHNILPHNTNHIGFHKWLRRWFAKQCDWLRVFSESTVNAAAEQLKIPESKFKILPEGDYTTVYPNTISPKEARNQLNLKKDDIVFLYLGYIKPYKGIENLIQEFNQLPNVKARLIIAGQGIDTIYTARMMAKINELQDERIRLLDTFIPEESLQVYYNAADMVVLPFDKVENSGSAIMAMGFKKVVIAPRMGVLRKRLELQKEFLYEDLKHGLEYAIGISRHRLEVLGEQNFNVLKENRWQDFQHLFIEGDLGISNN